MVPSHFVPCSGDLLLPGWHSGPKEVQSTVCLLRCMGPRGSAICSVNWYWNWDTICSSYEALFDGETDFDITPAQNNTTLTVSPVCGIQLLDSAQEGPGFSSYIQIEGFSFSLPLPLLSPKPSQIRNCRLRGFWQSAVSALTVFWLVYSSR